MKILVIEDHPKIREWIIYFLEKNFYETSWAIHWEEALKKLNQNKFDLIILDVNMPVMNWTHFIKSFRKIDNSTPIIALTSNGMLDDKIEMFELWCDDYLTKPFETKELLARIQAVLKRKWEITNQIIEIWNIKIDIQKHKIFKKEKEIEFPRKQYLIIEFLAQNIWITKNKTEILEKVWWELEENLNIDSITLEAHIYNIRKKLWKNFIKTVKWFWYVIE